MDPSTITTAATTTTKVQLVNNNEFVQPLITDSKGMFNWHHAVEGTIGLISGALGGCANVFVGQPMDTLKVKMQTFPHLYATGFDCFKQTIVNEGFFRGLYAGTLPALAANIAENSVLFAAHGFCAKGVTSLTGNQGKATPLENAVAGFFAAFFSSFTLCPTELVKCRLQSLREMGHEDISAYRLTNNIVKQEGIIGLFRGLTPTLAREMPGYFFFFGGYELSKSLITNGKPDEAGLSDTIIAGGIGGICLWSSIFPFDVAKSRMQIEPTTENMIQVMKRILKSEGIRGLYKGLGPTLLRTFPGTGALFVAVEYSKSFMTELSESIGWL